MSRMLDIRSNRTSQYTALAGGMDRLSSALAVEPGRLRECMNFEEVFSKQGYSTIQGYERFDGQTKPSSAVYYTLNYDGGGATAIAVGDTVTGSGGATGRVVSITLASGAWADLTAAGVMILTLVSGSWADNADIKVGGVRRAIANGASVRGTGADANYQVNLTAARNSLRALIAKVPGEGSVIGVAVYRATVYAIRNIVGSASATMWKSSSSGWTSVKTGLIPSGSWQFKVANFSGASTTLALFGVDGKNRLFKYDGTTFTKCAPIYGTEGTSTSNVTIGLGAKSFTIVEPTRSWVPAGGDLLTIWSTADAANSMRGVVTSYVSGTNTLNMNITSITGAGTINSWEIGKTDFSDKPFDVTAHKDHLFLSYVLGQLQSSNLGDPMTYTGTAALFGMGSELTDICSLKGAVMGIFCREKIHVLSGSSTSDWSMDLLTDGVGAFKNTAVDRAGNAFFLGDVGVQSLQSVQSFGNFEASSLSRSIKDYLAQRLTLNVGARMVKSSQQYRVYFSDKNVMRFTITSETAAPTGKNISPSRSVYIHQPTCFTSGVMSDNAEALFFGTDDGYVMQEDSGTSFDGTAIDYILLPHFNHLKSPEQNKRIHKITLELTSETNLTLKYRLLFDYDNGEYPHSLNIDAAILAPGGQYDVDAFDTFAFDGPMASSSETNPSGTGANIAMLLFFSSDFVAPVTLQGYLTQFTPLRMKR